MISFDNTEIAFASKTDKDLQWSYRLFKIIGRPWIVKMGKWMTNFALAIRLPIKGIIKRTVFKQFCGGETIAECEGRIKELDKYHIGTILDYSVEGKDGESDLDKTRDEIIATIDKAAGNPAIPFSVFKITGLIPSKALEAANKSLENLSPKDKGEHERAVARVEAICQYAFNKQVPIFIDAEDSWYQDEIDRLANEMMKKFNQEKAIVYNTVQMYRHDRLCFLEKSLNLAKSENFKLGIKLVRGAYMEKERERAIEKGYPSPIQSSKENTDRDYNLALEYLIKNIDRTAICAGTHNEQSSQYLTELMKEANIPLDDRRIYFAQLLGMSDHISFNLSHKGYNVAKYVPFGPVRDVMPYLIRRAEENTSVAGQTSRELNLLKTEKARRKL